MVTTSHELASIYRQAHNLMRNTDGLQPQEAFDELLKYLFFKQVNEERGPQVTASYLLSSDRLFLENEAELAQGIGELFSDYLSTMNSWSSQIWQDQKFRLNDYTLSALHRLMATVTFSKVSFDVRSAALKEFLPVEARRGLGIYLTPDDVVRMMVSFVSPQENEIVYDPACGSGTFLIEVLKAWQGSGVTTGRVWGADKNPRMLLLADLNMRHLANVEFRRRLMDSLIEHSADGENQDWLSSNSVDSILTNPPFGVVLDAATYDLGRFETCKTPAGEVRKKQQSEVVFVEQCLKLLRPGGTLAVVLPKSVITNVRLDLARNALDKLGYVYSVVTLPPESFHTTGTQTTTMVLFVKKYREGEDLKEQLRIGLVNVTNVGYDSTGRPRDANQLPQVASDLQTTLATASDTGSCKLLPPVIKGHTFSKLAGLLAGRTTTSGSQKLRDIVEVARTGKTPSRSSYTSEGLFVVKVGNLTGRGINWLPRERNFVAMPDETLRNGRKPLMLQEGDILLTASAHSPIYIAKKVDIVNQIPAWVGGIASFVGEVMMIRPKKDLVDPFLLLAYLRLPDTTDEIRLQVRGQTAHLHAEDILDLPVPDEILKPTSDLQLLADNLRQEAELNDRVNTIVREQTLLLQALTRGSVT